MTYIGFFLKQIFLENKSGQLFFQHEDINKFLFFQKGELVHAQSNRSQEMLGYILFNLGKISGRDYARINEFVEPKRNIGEVLVQNRVISREDLLAGLKYQMQEITRNIFSVFSGSFDFQEKAPLFKGDIAVRVSIPELIEDGIRSMPYEPELKSFFIGKRLLLKNKKFFSRLTGDEKEVFLAVEEAASIESDRLSSIFTSDSFWKHLYLLYCLDLVDVQADALREEEKPKPKTMEPEKADKKIEDVLKLSEQLSGLNYYEALNISRDASPDEIKKAYFTLARDYHPDIFGRDLTEEIKSKIGDVFDFINKSYKTLSHEANREQYDKMLASPKVVTKKDIQKGAEVKFRKGKTLFDQTRYEEAMVLLEEAVRMDPNKSNHFLLLALTQVKLEPYREQAVKNFKKAIELSPWTPDGLLGLGMLYKSEGMSALAAKQFKKVLEIDPDNRAAQKELDMIDSGSKKKGLRALLSSDLSSLFKKRK